ncbi:MAG: hypothetical protein BroJett011_10690 [Chloroflexota bacterium]|nr:MAG: hypothetical protein BroJett011_10690 [Chloroflexota bacterium]
MAVDGGAATSAAGETGGTGSQAARLSSGANISALRPITPIPNTSVRKIIANSGLRRRRTRRTDIVLLVLPGWGLIDNLG